MIRQFPLINWSITIPEIIQWFQQNSGFHVMYELIKLGIIIVHSTVKYLSGPSHKWNLLLNESYTFTGLIEEKFIDPDMPK